MRGQGYGGAEGGVEIGGSDGAGGDEDGCGVKQDYVAAWSLFAGEDGAEDLRRS